MYTLILIHQYIDVLVLSRKFRNEILKEYHDKCGNQGIDGHNQ